MSYNRQTNERQFLVECIRLYKQLPALWQIHSKLYTDKEEKKRAYNILLKKYQELYPNADKDALKKKINSLRTNFRKELRKMKIFIMEGSAYTPSLWYYDELKFLVEQEDNIPSPIIVQNNLYETDEQKNEPLSDTEDILDFKSPSIIDPSNHIDAQMDIPDEFDQIGRVWSNDLRQMEPIQRLLARKFINEILLDGRLGTLRRDSLNFIDHKTND